MSVEALALVLHHSRAKGAAKLVLLGIANHAGDGGSWPTVETLARYANVSERRAQEHLRTLEQLGEVATYRQAGGTRDTPDHLRSNRYEVLVRCPLECDGTANHRPHRDLRIAARARPEEQLELGVRNLAPGAESRTPTGAESRTLTVPDNPPSTTDHVSVTAPRAREAAPVPADEGTRQRNLDLARAALDEARR